MAAAFEAIPCMSQSRQGTQSQTGDTKSDLLSPGPDGKCCQPNSDKYLLCHVATLHRSHECRLWVFVHLHQVCEAHVPPAASRCPIREQSHASEQQAHTSNRTTSNSSSRGAPSACRVLCSRVCVMAPLASRDTCGIAPQFRVSVPANQTGTGRLARCGDLGKALSTLEGRCWHVIELICDH